MYTVLYERNQRRLKAALWAKQRSGGGALVAVRRGSVGEQTRKEKSSCALLSEETASSLRTFPLPQFNHEWDILSHAHELSSGQLQGRCLLGGEVCEIFKRRLHGEVCM